MDQDNPNPFASPAVAAASAIPDRELRAEMQEFDFSKSLGKWLLVCFVSAAPSYYFGFGLGPHHIIQSIAMVLGILTYVVAYVYIESRESTRRMLTNRPLKLAVKVGFVTRVAISVLFPIGMTIDMICGMFAVGIMSSVFGVDYIGVQYSESQDLSLIVVFAWFYSTTLLQGLFLNIILGGYTMIVFAFALLLRTRSQPKS